MPAIRFQVNIRGCVKPAGRLPGIKHVTNTSELGMKIEYLGVAIPLVAIVMGIGMAMLGVVLDYRKKKDIYELHHRERMAAIEKGMEIPPLPLEFFQRPGRPRNPAGMLRTGLILLFSGAALILAMSKELGEISWWGLIPVGVGLAFVITFLYERAHPPANNGGG
jgi:hypothetical protein